MEDHSWLFWLGVLFVILVIVFVYSLFNLYQEADRDSVLRKCNAHQWTDAVTAPNGDVYCVRWDTDGTGYIAALERLEGGE